MKERLIIVVIAVILGLAATTLGYFIYQSTKLPTEAPAKQAVKGDKTTPTPIENNSIFVTIDEPKENSVVTNRTVEVKGKTNQDNTIIVSTNQEDQVAKPASDGSFSVSITIDAGTNRLITRAIAPDGNEKTDIRTVSFSTADF